MRVWFASLSLLLLGCGGIAVDHTSHDSGASSDSSSVSMGGSSGAGSSSGVSSSSSSGGFTGSSSGGNTGSSSGGIDDAGTSSGGGGPDCGQVPSLHESAPGDIFCLGPGPNGLFCNTGTQCCASAGGSTDNVCSPWMAQGAGCVNPPGSSVGVACNQISDCAANGQSGALACCLQGGIVAPVAGCGYPRARGGTAIACEERGSSDGGVEAAPCGPGEFNVCSSQADCPAGTTCTAGKWGEFQIGFCM